MKTNGLFFWILGLISLIVSLCALSINGTDLNIAIAVFGSQLSVIIIALGFIIANQEKKRGKDDSDGKPPETRDKEKDDNE